MNRQTKEWFAIKSIRKAKVSKIEVLKREIEILKEVKHPNIIALVDVFEDNKYLHLVTELCTGGELFDRIIAKTHSAEGHFSEHDAAMLVADILDAIAYCHDKKGIVHRDLKPENFLFLTEDEKSPIKIIDFGLSRHNDANQGIMKTKVGKFLQKQTVQSSAVQHSAILTRLTKATNNSEILYKQQPTKKWVPHSSVEVRLVDLIILLFVLLFLLKRFLFRNTILRCTRSTP